MNNENVRPRRRPARGLALAAACTALAAMPVAAATAPASQAAAASGPPNQVFSTISLTAHGTERPMTVVGSGAITAEGRTSERSLGHDLLRLTLRFPTGTLVLRTRENLTWKPDFAACLATGRGGASWRVVGGTGAYAGATGSGRYVNHGTLLGSRDSGGACLGTTAPPVYVIVTADFTGRVVLPAS